MTDSDMHLKERWICPKCGFKSFSRQQECPKCGVIISKLFAKDVQDGLDEELLIAKYQLTSDEFKIWIGYQAHGPKPDRVCENRQVGDRQTVGTYGSVPQGSEGNIRIARSPRVPFSKIYRRRILPFLKFFGGAFFLVFLVSLAVEWIPKSITSPGTPKVQSRPEKRFQYTPNKTNDAEFDTRVAVPAAPEIGGTAFESQIDGAFEGWEGETVVKLTNGQIWIQTDGYYEYDYAYMPDVIVYNTGSGWKMKVEGISESVSVTRLK
jgi:hypothetical protein